MTLSNEAKAKSIVPEVQAGPGILRKTPEEPHEANNNQDIKLPEAETPEIPTEAPLAAEEDYEIVEPVHHADQEDQAEKTENSTNHDAVIELKSQQLVQDQSPTPKLQAGTPIPNLEVPEVKNHDPIQEIQDKDTPVANDVPKLEASEDIQDNQKVTQDHPAEKLDSSCEVPEVFEASNGPLLVPDLTVDKTGSNEIATPFAAVNGNIDRTEVEQETPEKTTTVSQKESIVTQDETTVTQEESFVVVEASVEKKAPEEITLIHEEPQREQELYQRKKVTLTADLSSGPPVHQTETPALEEAKPTDAPEVNEAAQDNNTASTESIAQNDTETVIPTDARHVDYSVEAPQDKIEIRKEVQEIVENQSKSLETNEIHMEELKTVDKAVVSCTDDSTTLQSSRCDVSACKPSADEQNEPVKHSAATENDREVPDIDQLPSTEAVSPIPSDNATSDIQETSDTQFSEVVLTESETSEESDSKLPEEVILEAKGPQTTETEPGPPSEETQDSSEATHPIPTVVVSEASPVSEEAGSLAPIHEDCELAATPVKVSMTTGSPTPPPRKLSPSGSVNSPVPPPRRPSTVGGTLPRSGSRATIISKSSTFNRAGSQGRLQFNALPRNSHPPTREEVGKKKRSMFSWLGGNSSKKNNKEVLETVSEGLRKIYKQKLYPLEEHYKFHDFHSPALDDPDFDAKPMILLVGQYSTGKTTFIRHILERDFPGIRIGPEPTTDRFIAVMHGDEEGVIPGNALVVDAKKQFRALSGFGNAFLNRFQCSTLPNQVLESVTIVDTPGILSGEKQRIDRGYDFTGVLEWFAERVDRIILLFDAHKLDISDEFKRCIEALAGNEDKIRIVLNKSDMVDHQQLMRVYGALMWSLGKVFRTPEVSRVYLGSFWDHPLHYDINRRLFQDEQHDLFQDLQALPRNAALRKLNDLIKRARLAKVNAYIISELRKQMPSMIGKEKKKKELIQNLDKIFEQIQREHNISPGDFPDVNKMREKLQNHDFTKFNPMKPKLLEVVDGMLASDIARLMAQIPKEEQVSLATNGHTEQPTVRGGAFSGAQEAETPFGFGRGEGFDKGANESEWVVSRERNTADTTFESLEPVDGYVSGRAAKEHMVKSKLPNAVLGKIWKLADVDKDGQLDSDEFALANYLINLKLEGHELPSELPDHLVPPSKREQAQTVYPNLGDDE